MRNPFRTPLPTQVRGSDLPAEYGYPGTQFDFPEEVTLNDANYPDETGIEGGVATWRSNTGELFQEQNPEYAGDYKPEIPWSAGASPGNDIGYSTNPAPGSVDLAFARYEGGVPGTNTLLGGDGPVSGENSEWTGTQGQLHRPNPNYNGPVSGGPDYSNQLAAAFFQQQAAQYSQQYAESAMVSAV